MPSDDAEDWGCGVVVVVACLVAVLAKVIHWAMIEGQ